MSAENGLMKFLVISENTLSTEASRSAVRNRCNGAFKSGKDGRCDRKEAVGREAGRLYSIDNQHKLCNCEAGSYEEKHGYYRWIGRMYFDRNNFHICGTCNLYSVTRSGFSHRSEWEKNGKKFKMYKFRSMYMDAEEWKKS